MLSACQSAVYLMPAPVVLHSDKIQAFERNHADLEGNIVRVFYVTNRLPLGLQHDRNYTTLYTDTLRFGEAHVRIGEKSKPWDFLKALSIAENREKALKLTLEQSDEIGKVADGGDHQAIVAAINQALSHSLSKDITVYIHGATADFYSTMAQAAQVRHFTGYNHIILAFAWPTAENFLFYGTDVNTALKTAPMLTSLLHFLAENTDVRQINVLAYSAGGRVASSGLAELGKQFADSDGEDIDALKLGEVYFAAPDVEIETYVQQLHHYSDLVKDTTIALNPHDFVLNLSHFYQGSTRIGRPAGGKLSEPEVRWLAAASNNGELNVIRILPEIMKGYDAGSHDFWFSHPWVSTDVLIQMLFHAEPEERGLKAEYTEEFKWWHFPLEYPQVIPDILLRLEEEAKAANAFNTDSLPE